jgi:hypothetical protein
MALFGKRDSRKAFQRLMGDILAEAAKEGISDKTFETLRKRMDRIEVGIKIAPDAKSASHLSKLAKELKKVFDAYQKMVERHSERSDHAKTAQKAVLERIKSVEKEITKIGLSFQPGEKAVRRVEVGATKRAALENRKEFLAQISGQFKLVSKVASERNDKNLDELRADLLKGLTALHNDNYTVYHDVMSKLKDVKHNYRVSDRMKSAMESAGEQSIARMRTMEKIASGMFSGAERLLSTVNLGGILRGARSIYRGYKAFSRGAERVQNRLVNSIKISRPERRIVDEKDNLMEPEVQPQEVRTETKEHSSHAKLSKLLRRLVRKVDRVLAVLSRMNRSRPQPESRSDNQPLEVRVDPQFEEADRALERRLSRRLTGAIFRIASQNDKMLRLLKSAVSRQKPSISSNKTESELSQAAMDENAESSDRRRQLQVLSQIARELTKKGKGSGKGLLGGIGGLLKQFMSGGLMRFLMPLVTSALSLAWKGIKTAGRVLVGAAGTALKYGWKVAQKAPAALAKILPMIRTLMPILGPVGAVLGAGALGFAAGNAFYEKFATQIQDGLEWLVDMFSKGKSMIGDAVKAAGNNPVYNAVSTPLMDAIAAATGADDKANAMLNSPVNRVATDPLLNSVEPPTPASASVSAAAPPMQMSPAAMTSTVSRTPTQIDPRAANPVEVKTETDEPVSKSPAQAPMTPVNAAGKVSLSTLPAFSYASEGLMYANLSGLVNAA